MACLCTLKKLTRFLMLLSFVLVVISTTQAQTNGTSTGTSSDQYIINNDVSNNWGTLRIQTSNDRGWTLFNDGSLSFYFSTGNLTSLGTNLMSLTNTGSLSVSGNVGIGTFMPLEKLDVRGNISAKGTIFVSRNVILDGTSNKIGIGTSNPTEALDITGNIKASGNITANSLNIPSLTTTGNITASGATSKVGIGIAIPTEALDVVGNIKSSGSVTANSLNVIGVVSGSSLSTVGNIIASGAGSKVGIGTAMPTEALHVVGNIKTSGTVTSGSISTGAIISSAVTTTGVLTAGTISTGNITSTGRITASELAVPSLSTSGAVSVSSLSTTGKITTGGNLLLSSASKLGIGVTSPTAAIDVVGSVKVSENLVVKNILSPVLGTGPYDDLPIIKVGASSNPVNLTVENGWISASTVQANQFLNTPTVITGTVTAQQYKFEGSNVSLGTSGLGQNGSQHSVFIGNNAGTDFGSTHWEGGSNPLNHNKSVFVLNNQAQLGNPLLFGTFADNADKASATSPSTSMAQLAINTHHLLPNCALTVSGAVHVGPQGIDPSAFSVRDSLYQNYLLWVQKGIVSEDYAIAKVSTWSDFVFNQDYKLPPLSEVESYITANKHLSGIPSEAEVKENGYSIHKLNVTLLQKVEELTLYAIEQQKEIEELKRLLQQVIKNK